MDDHAQSIFEAGPPPAWPDRLNMAAYVMAAAKRTPEKTALRVISGPGRAAQDWSYGRLDQAIRATAATLIARGLAPGDRVALRLSNSVAFPLMFFGVIAAGGIAVPTSPALTEREFLGLIDDMRPRFAAISSEFDLELPIGVAAIGERLDGEAAPIGGYANTMAGDPAFMIYTSGVSGRPKGVLHAHRSAWARRMMWQGWYGLGADDLLMHAGALNWSYTLGTGLTDPWAAGATSLVYAGAATPELWADLIVQEGPTIFAAVPGVYRGLLRALPDRPDLGALRHGLSAGEALPATIRASWEERTGKPLLEAFGMSEISTFISEAPGGPRRAGCCGYPQPGRRVAVLDESRDDPTPRGTPGRLAVARSDPGLMLGYWERPDEMAISFSGEWFVTGDRARMHEDGAIEHLGRSDEVMTALGYRINPVEIETVLGEHPDIRDLAVAELPVRDDLSLIAGFVVAQGAWPGEAALIRFAQTRLAAYKIPKIWIECAALPRTANHKLMRRSLIETHRRDR